jgi:hypothetical protein
MDMMREAIEKRAGQTLIAKDARPFLEWQIRRDDRRSAFMTLAEYFEKRFRRQHGGLVNGGDKLCQMAA